VSDAVVPSYRIAREESRFPWRGLLIALAVLLGLAAAGWAGWAALRHRVAAVPVVEAPAGPIKVRPAERGGFVAPNQDNQILQGRNAQQAAPARLAPQAEAPDLAALRQHGAPRPAPAPAPAAAPAAPPQAAAPPAPARPSTAPVPGGRVQVQLGALGSEEAARAEWDRLARRLPELFADRRPAISRIERGADQPPIFRIRTGGFGDADSARAFCEQVRARGGACAVLPG
jgi:hypothetical protein